MDSNSPEHCFLLYLPLALKSSSITLIKCFDKFCINTRYCGSPRLSLCLELNYLCWQRKIRLASLRGAMAVLHDIDRYNSNKKTPNGSTNYLANADNYSDTMSSDSEDIREELRNIESVITLTRNNIDALNEKFACFQNPPSMYLQEYEHLTSKLHDLLAQKNRLRDQLSGGRDSPDDATDSQYHSSYPEVKYDTLTRTKFLRAHLPNQQRTSVQVREGLTLRDALAKAMKLRNLICEMCSVYLGGTDIVVNWDTDISTLNCEEITVKILDKFPIHTSISHNFVRKTFFSLVFCECCRRLLFQGFSCRTCGYKFHQRCASGVPALCHQVSIVL